MILIASIKPAAKNVHYDNTLWTEGNNIESYYVRQGTAGRPLCEHCARLAREGG